MEKPDKSPVRISIAYNFWVDDWMPTFIRRLESARHEYVDISDMGTSRMSKRMAFKFLEFLRNGIVSGSIPVEDLSASYAEKKGNRRVGIQTMEMLEGLTAYRTNLGGEKKHKGWLVGIKDKTPSSREYPLYFRLSWLEFGTVEQDDRPIVATAFRQFVGAGLVEETVRKMLARGAYQTEEKRKMYGGGSTE